MEKYTSAAYSGYLYYETASLPVAVEMPLSNEIHAQKKSDFTPGPKYTFSIWFPNDIQQHESSINHIYPFSMFTAMPPADCGPSVMLPLHFTPETTGGLKC